MLSPDPPAKTDNWVNMTLLPRCHSGKESVCQRRRCRFDPWVGKIPWRRKQQPTPENSIDRGPGGLQSMGSQGVGHDLVTEHVHIPP